MDFRHIFLFLFLAGQAAGQDQTTMQEPLDRTPPGTATVPASGSTGGPSTKKVRGILQNFTGVKSIENYNGIDAEVDGVPLSETRLVTHEMLKKLDGRRVEVVYHTERDGGPGRWSFSPPVGPAGPIETQRPMGEPAPFVHEVKDGGVTIAHASWVEARQGNYPMLSIREIQP